MPSTVWRIKTRNSSSTFHFTCRGFTGSKRREGKKKKKVTKTNSTKDRSCSRARGGVWKSGTSRVFATQTVRECGTVDSSPHEFMNLLLACHYGCMLSRKAPKRVGRETGPWARGSPQIWYFTFLCFSGLSVLAPRSPVSFLAIANNHLSGKNFNQSHERTL